MYEPHPSITAPDNPNTVIWRYLRLAKFLDMLERRALRFTQLDSLRDPFEGAPADVNLEAERAADEEIRAMLAKGGGIPEELARAWKRESRAASIRLTCPRFLVHLF